MKECSKCHEFKPETDFYHNRCNTDGLQCCCKSCSKNKSKSFYDRNSSAVIDKAKKRNLTAKPWLKKYGLTKDEYQNMLEKQNGVCAICKDLCTTGRLLAVDHCHNTGKIRGLLCCRCNQTLGKIKDSISWLQNAANYLNKAT